MKIPYSLIPAVPLDERYAQMRSAIARPLPRLQNAHIDDAKTLSIACYGPSLRETWRQLQRPILSMSGATKWLAERGVTADFHIEMDPRKNKVQSALPPVPGVTYLVASVCCPEYFDALEDAGSQVILWHTVSSNWQQDMEWVAREDPGQFVVSTGSTIGLGAIQLGGLLGYRRFEIHGMDGSFAQDGVRHAGLHAGKTQRDDQTWDAGGVRYRTSKIMANACAETVNTFRNFPIIAVFHGDGLTQALIREENLPNTCCADQAEKRALLAMVRPQIMDVPPMAKGDSPWRAWLRSLQPTDVADLIGQIPVCEARRATAAYNTGTVPFDTAVYLRAISRFYQPQVVAEVGTFIGTSTHALVASRVTYTCDQSNDCVPLSDAVVTHPGRSSTQMFADMSEAVDLFFFDGRIQDADLPHIQRLSHARTVYLVDDYTGKEKGTANVAKLQRVSGHALIPPRDGSTLAAMVPALAA